MESIKIGNKTYLLVADGYQFGTDGGRLIFRPGDDTFDQVEAAMAGADSIRLLDDTGDVIASRTDLVYAGRLTKDAAYTIGIGDQGEDVTGPVMVAEFRLPDVREALAETNAKLDYVAMMADVEV